MNSQAFSTPLNLSKATKQRTI